MKKTTIILCLALVQNCFIYAQNKMGQSDDVSRIAVTPVILERTNVPENAKSTLLARLQQIVSNNGIGGSGYDQKFIITANIIEVGKDVSTSTPPMYTVKMEPYFYVGDVSNGNLFSSCSLGEIKGMGKTEELAYQAVIKNIKANDPKIVKCLDEAKIKIIEYYNSQIDFLVTKAEAMADQENYLTAIRILMDVPEVCKDAYQKSMTSVGKIYQRKIDSESAKALSSAKAVWNATLSYDGALEASEYLSEVHPNSSSSGAANQLNQEIAKRVREIDNREWNYQLKAQENDYNLSKAALEAAKEIGKAEANRPVYLTNRIYWW